MTSFNKNATGGGPVAAVDPAFQILALVVTGALSALALSAAMGTQTAPFFAALPEALHPEAAARVNEGLSRFRWEPHGRIFLYQWLGLFAPFAASLVLFHLSLPGLHRNARRLGAYLLATAYVLVSLGALKASNRAWGGSEVLAFLPTGSTTVYQFLRAALFTLAALGLCVPFIFQGQRDSGRVMRVALVVGLFGGWVAWDWRQSREARQLGDSSAAPGVSHRFVLLLPDTTQDTLLEALAMPESQGFKERLLAMAPVLPVSGAEMPQLASLISAAPPWRHGVRSDAPSKESLGRVAGLVPKGGDGSGVVRYFANPGMPHAVGTLFDTVAGAEGEGHACTPEASARSRVAMLEASPLLPALVPARVVRETFPDLACSQRYAPLEDLVARELDAIAAQLRDAPAVDAWFYLRPHPRDGWQGLEEEWSASPSPGSLRQLSAHRLAGALQVLSDQLSTWSTWQNTEVWLVGLGGTAGEWGAFSVHSGAPDRGAVKELGGVLVSQVTLGELVRPRARRGAGAAAVVAGEESPATRAEVRQGNRPDFEAYSERPLAAADGAFEPWALEPDATARERADWRRTALARSDRSTLCRIERALEGGGKATDSLLVTLHGGRDASGPRISPRLLAGTDSRAPTFKGPEECLKAARDALVGTWTLDVDLPPLKWELLARAALPSQDQNTPTGVRQ